MGLAVRIYSDYVCPFCFLHEGPLYDAVKVVEQERGEAIEVRWMPFELRPEPTPTLKPEGEYLQTAWESSVYPMARQMGVEIRLPSVSPQPYSRLAFEGSLYAEDHGKANEYHDAIFRAFFQQDKDIGQVNVLRGVAESVGLDGTGLSAALESGTYREEHVRRLRHTVEEVGIRSVPTTFIGDVLLAGVQPSKEIEAVLRRVYGLD